MNRKAIAWGTAAGAGLFGAFAGITALLSDTVFLANQIASYWQYLVPLAVGFGIQVGLYVLIRERIKESRSVVAASGTVSGVSMISCCAHYVVNLMPALAATGAVAFVAQYQEEFFWVGLVGNGAGISYFLYHAIRINRILS